jgi:hypothetical protein
MSGDAKGSGVTVPASLTSTTSLTSPIVNATTSLNTHTVNATTLTLAKTTITEDILFDLMNTQSGNKFSGDCQHGCNFAPVITFKIPFKKKPLVYTALTQFNTGNSNWGWGKADPVDITTTGFKITGAGHGGVNIRWLAIYSNITENQV